MAMNFDETQRAAPQPQAAAAPVGPASRTPWNFMNTGGFGGISRASTSESLTRATKHLSEAYKERVPYDRDQLVVTVLPIDRNVETNLRLSGLAVAVHVKGHAEIGICYHTLLLDGSGEALPQITEQWNGQSIPVDRFPSDVLDREYLKTVDRIVKKAFPGAETFSCSGEVVPADFDWENQDKLLPLAVNALLACTSDLGNKAGVTQPLNLADWDHNQMLQVALQFNDRQIEDYVGLPVRNDISVVITALDKNRNNLGSVNAPDSVKTIARAGGFLNLLYIKQQIPTNPYNYGQQVTPTYAPQFVITNMENLLRSTTEAQLFVLAQLKALAENNNWIPYFAPRHDVPKGQIDLKDPGAINFEANIYGEASGYGARIKTKDAAFTNAHLGALLKQALVPEMFFAIDISAAGSDTWYNEVLAAAADGNAQAAAHILHAAAQLTNGRFNAYYGSNESPVVINHEIIQLGWYEGADGRRHDIREIDTLAIANRFGDSDATSIQAWTDTFTRTDYPVSKRLAERKKMITEAIGGSNIRFTGTARRVSIAGKFLDSLIKGSIDCNVETKTTSSAFGQDYVNQRGQLGYYGQAAVSMTPSGMFNPGFANPAGAGVYGGGYAFRGGW